MTSTQIAELRDFISGELGKVHGRFDGVDRRLERVESRLDRLDSRLDGVGGRLDQMDIRLDGVGGRLDQMDTRLDRMDGRFDQMDGRLDRMDERFDQMDGRLDQMNGRLDGVERGLVEVRAQLREVQVEQHAFQAHVARHFGVVYKRFDDVSTRLAQLELQREEMRSDFRAFGESLQATNRRMDEFQSNMMKEFRDLRGEMREGFNSWGRRVIALENREA